MKTNTKITFQEDVQGRPYMIEAVSKWGNVKDQFGQHARVATWEEVTGDLFLGTLDGQPVVVPKEHYRKTCRLLGIVE